MSIKTDLKKKDVREANRDVIDTALRGLSFLFIGLFILTVLALLGHPVLAVHSHAVYFLMSMGSAFLAGVTWR